MTSGPKPSLRFRIASAMLLVSLLPLALLAVAAYVYQSRTAIELAEGKLAAIRNLKQREARLWVRGAAAELKQLAHNPILAAGDPDATSRFLERAAADSLFFQQLRLMPDTSDARTPAGPTLQWTGMPEAKPVLTLRYPVNGGTGRNLAGDVDLSETLASQIGAAALFDGEQSIWLTDPAGRLIGAAGDASRHNPPSDALRGIAARGDTTLLETADAAGHPVLAATGPLAGLDLAIIVTQDRAAALASLQPFGPMAGLLTAIALLLVAGAGLTVSRSIARPVKDLTDVLTGTAPADRPAALAGLTANTRELDTLVSAFKSMTRTVAHQLHIEHTVAALAADLLPIREQDQWVRRAAAIAATHCNADLAAVYEKTSPDRFTPVAAVGADPATLPEYNADAGEGEPGRLLATNRNLLRLDLPLEVKTVMGNITPTTILAIPLRHEEGVAGFLVLGYFRKPDAWVTNMLERAAGPFSAALSGVRYAEQIRLMAQELAEQNTELEHQKSELEIQARELEQQTTELEAQNLELDHQKQELETAGRYKSEFISTMSHELRTPLNAIISLSRLLKDQPAGHELKQEEYLNIIERNGRQLLTLINDILDLSRIEAGYLHLAPSTVRVPDLLAGVAEMCRPLAEEKGLVLEVSAPDDLPPVTSDAARLQQILINLTGNAIKFTDQGTVTLTAEHRESDVRIHVQDTGIGIPEDQLSDIFEPFQQGDGSTRRRHPGTGLGLAISRRLANALGGDLTATSQPGTGSTFTLTLPVHPSLEWDTPAPASSPEPVPSSPAPVETPQPAETAHLLLVEDNDVARDQVAGVLRRAGYRVTSVTSGEAALAAVSETIPDGIILDLMMPGMDGFDLLEQIRSRPETAFLPVLILTAKDLTPKELGRLTANNVQQLIRKGDINRQELLLKIRLLLGNVPRSTGPMPAPPAPDPDQNGKKPVALLIEDNPDNTAVIRALLSPYLTVLTAPDGETGLEIVAARHVDVVLLDIMMPGMDGIEVARRIRCGDRNGQVPIVAVSAMATARDRELVLSSDCDAYVPKPVDRQALLETIRRFVQLNGERE